MSVLMTCDKCGDSVVRHGVDALAAAVAAYISPSICRVRGCGGTYRKRGETRGASEFEAFREYLHAEMNRAKVDALAPFMEQSLLRFQESLADRADRWMHSPGGRHVMRDLYALASKYARDWLRTGIPISMKLLFEIERQRIKTVTSRAQSRGIRISKDDGYSLNNSRTAYIARHIMDRRKDWDGLFELRELKEER